MKTYRDLIAWQKSMTFVADIYQVTVKFPQEELYGLTSQIRRSSIAIPSNIAEGYGRNSRKDYSRFISIAIGSLYECQTQLELSFNLNYCTENVFDKIYEQAREIERMLSSLRYKLNQTA